MINFLSKKLILLIVVFGCLTGVSCSYRNQIDYNDPFVKLYTEAIESGEKSTETASPEKKFTFSVADMAMIDFARYFVDTTFCGIVFVDGMENKKLTAEFFNASASDIIDVVSRRFEIEAVRVGDTYFLGKLKPEDRGVLVSRVYGYDIEEIRSCVTAFQSETGRFAVYRNGVVVVADRESVLRRISSMLSQLSRTSGNTWILQFFIVAQKKDLNLMYGSSVKTSGQVAYGLNDGSFSESDALSQSLNASFDSNSEFYDLRASPMLLLRDGSSGKWSDGVSVPVPQKTVSQYGVVTTTGFSYIDTGIVLSVSLREAVDGAFLKLDYQDSSIRGYVEYQPIIAKASLTSECSIQSSKIYLMGELVKRDEKDSATEVFNFKTERGGIKNQVFCRVFRVGSPDIKKPNWRKPTAEESAAVEPSATESRKD